MYAADLTKKERLTESRLKIYGVTAKLSQQNAENTTFDDSFFDHINCQGVRHHTPATEATISEIARILKSNGTASISVSIEISFYDLGNI